jgi:hypothetical protein
MLREGLKMKPVASVFACLLLMFASLLWVTLAAPQQFAQTKPSSEQPPTKETGPAQTKPSSEQAPTKETGPAVEESYQLVVFLPSYRFVTTSGFPGRVAEYDSLNQSVGGDLALTLIGSQRRYSWKYLADFQSRDEYNMDSQLRLGPYFTLGINSRSLIRHLDDVPIGTNFLNLFSLGPDDIFRTDTVPEGALFGVKRTQSVVNARLKVPDAPLTFYVRGGWQARRGTTQLQFYDMGATPDPNTCGTCHQVSRFRSVNYTTRNVAAGLELKGNHAVITYEHSYSSFNDRLLSPVDLYGSALSLEGEPLGAPDTLAGNLVHNVLPSHRTHSDTLRMRVALPHALAFNGNFTYSHLRNRFTGNLQKALNGDATLNWNPHPRVRAMLDYHQQNLLNDFTPGFFQFGNPSLHRYWVGTRLDYRLASFADAEVHYRRTHVTRSNAVLWPQVYSPSTLGLVDTPADPWVTRLVPTSFSNTAGVALRFHRGERGNLRLGYEWIGTHAPGYLTDPETSHRPFASGSYALTSWLTVSNDFSVLLQSSFPRIQRKNRLWLNTSYLTITPVPEWSLSAGYGYYQNNLKTDLMYGTDPSFYLEPLVPFKSLSQSYTVSSNLLLKKKLAWRLDAGHVSSHTDFRPNLLSPLIPSDCGPDGTQACSDSVAFARAISLVAVPQYNISSSFDYRWRGGLQSGLRFQYASYTDRVPRDATGQLVRPALSGHFRTLSVFFGRTW